MRALTVDALDAADVGCEPGTIIGAATSLFVGLTGHMSGTPAAGDFLLTFKTCAKRCVGTSGKAFWDANKLELTICCVLGHLRKIQSCKCSNTAPRCAE